MRIVFVGTVGGSKIALDAMARAGFVPTLVVTLPHEAAHRHSDFVDLTGTARDIGSRVFHTKNINAPETLVAIRSEEPDLCLVIGWSQICRQPFREIARWGNVGFHPSALPKLRGRAVIPWTILTDQRETGSTLFWLDEGIDSGEILLQRLFPLAADETADSLSWKHAGELQSMLPEALSLVQAGTAPRVIQDHEQATYCAKRTPDDGLIDWRSPAADILRLVRACGDPYPGAFTCQQGEKLYISHAVSLPSSDHYIGLIGQVQCFTERGFAVRCGDAQCIDVQEWRWCSGGVPKMHSKFDSTGSFCGKS